MLEKCNNSLYKAYDINNQIIYPNTFQDTGPIFCLTCGNELVYVEKYYRHKNNKNNCKGHENHTDQDKDKCHLCEEPIISVREHFKHKNDEVQGGGGRGSVTNEMSEFHRKWQNIFSQIFREVPIGEHHRADIYLNQKIEFKSFREFSSKFKNLKNDFNYLSFPNLTIEIQHSATISDKDICSRQQTYQNLIWICDIEDGRFRILENSDTKEHYIDLKNARYNYIRRILNFSEHVFLDYGDGFLYYLLKNILEFNQFEILIFNKDKFLKDLEDILNFKVIEEEKILKDNNLDKAEKILNIATSSTSSNSSNSSNSSKFSLLWNSTLYPYKPSPKFFIFKNDELLLNILNTTFSNHFFFQKHFYHLDYIANNITVTKNRYQHKHIFQEHLNYLDKFFSNVNVSLSDLLNYYLKICKFLQYQNRYQNFQENYAFLTLFFDTFFGLHYANLTIVERKKNQLELKNIFYQHCYRHRSLIYKIIDEYYNGLVIKEDFILYKYIEQYQSIIEYFSKEILSELEIDYNKYLYDNQYEKIRIKKLLRKDFRNISYRYFECRSKD